MTWVEDRAGDASRIVTEQGESVSYTAYGASAATVSAVWSPADSPESVSDGRQEVRRGTVQVLPTVATAPDTRDTFEITEKRGDNSHLNIAAASPTSPTITGLADNNSDSRTLYWQITGSGPYTVSFYKSASLAAGAIVAQATGVAAGAAYSATQQNSSGLTVAGTAGSAPVTGATGTLSRITYHVERIRSQRWIVELDVVALLGR